jgi:hypothetical protein
VAGRHLPPGGTVRVRGSRAASRSVARWLTRQGFDARPESADQTDAAPALVVLGSLDADHAGGAAEALQDGGRLVVCRLRPESRAASMDLTTTLAHAGFVRVGHVRTGGLLSIRATWGELRRLPDRAQRAPAAGPGTEK